MRGCESTRTHQKSGCGRRGKGVAALLRLGAVRSPYYNAEVGRGHAPRGPSDPWAVSGQALDEDRDNGSAAEIARATRGSNGDPVCVEDANKKKLLAGGRSHLVVV